MVVQVIALVERKCSIPLSSRNVASAPDGARAEGTVTKDRALTIR